MRRLSCLFIAAATFFYLSGCAKTPSYSRDDVLMDTFVRIDIRANALSESQKSLAAQRAIERMKFLEKRFDYYADKSELSGINNLEAGEEFFLSLEMFTILKRSEELLEETEGAFDVAMGSGTWKLDGARKTITLEKKGTKINLGGIAKGLIVDEGIKILRENGIKNALIDAGGDIYCMGEGATSRGWKIGLRDPRNRRGIIAVFNIRDKGVATSGGYERPSHIVDPRTRNPVGEVFGSTTVIADNCMTADAMATALYVLGPEKGCEVIEAMPGVECFIIGPGGKRYSSSGFRRLTNHYR